MGRIVCFTGHRQIPVGELEALQAALEREIRAQIEAGAEVFRTGGALGFDTLAALSVLLLRKEYPQIRLELILPCPTQTRGWSENDVRLYEQILSQADSHRYVGSFYYNGILQQRNRELVAGANACIAYLRTSSGGSAYTAALALKSGVELINLADS